MTTPTTTTDRALTEQHRLAQMRLRAAALRDFLTLWPLWKGDRQTFADLVQATLPLVNVYRDASSTLAASYVQAMRDAHGIDGALIPALAAAITPGQLIASLYVTSEVTSREALNAGMSLPAVRATALTRVSGAVSRHVLNAGRQTVVDTANADPRAVGWARVTDGDPCYFCLTLASRGAVYKSEQSADFQAHDHCGCTAMPVYKGTRLPESSLRARQIYEDAQTAGVESGLLHPGENTSAARLNAVRRFLAQS